MSTCQVVHNMKIEGGFLGMLAGLVEKAISRKDCLTDIGNWGTFKHWLDFGTKSNKQSDGKWAVFDK